MLFDGRDLAKLSEQELTRERIRFGYLFQSAALFDSMTVGAERGISASRNTPITTNDKIREIVLARLAEVGLPESVASKKPAELSGGMRKRVGLARRWSSTPS